jgi:hypothetical protein
LSADFLIVSGLGMVLPQPNAMGDVMQDYSKKKFILR